MFGIVLDKGCLDIYTRDVDTVEVWCRFGRSRMRRSKSPLV